MSRREAAMPKISPRLALAALALCGALGAGCVSDETLANDLVRSTPESRAGAPLGGAALAQRKRELERAFGDLGHFNVTLETLQRRGDRNGGLIFKEFVDHYLLRQVLPLLEGEWQSRHPEVAAHDADLRLAVAELWSRLGAGSRSERMLDEIERRYAGRGDMLVSGPHGGQHTLREAVERLRARGWWRG